MNKIKDLIYDFNDVFVALLIVAVAGAVLVWRVNIVMDYPNQSAKTNGGTQIDVNFDDVDLTQEEVDVIIDPEYEEQVITTEPAVTEPVENTDDNKSSEDDTKDNNTNTSEETENKETSTTVKQYTLVISKDNKNTNWTAVSNQLKKNGIIQEDDNLGKKATELKLDGSLQLGTFELNSGMSLEEIVRAITK